eukprot:gene1688-4813_t
MLLLDETFSSVSSLPMTVEGITLQRDSVSEALVANPGQEHDDTQQSSNSASHTIGDNDLSDNDGNIRPDETKPIFFEQNDGDRLQTTRFSVQISKNDQQAAAQSVVSPKAASTFKSCEVDKQPEEVYHLEQPSKSSRNTELHFFYKADGEQPNLELHDDHDSQLDNLKGMLSKPSSSGLDQEHQVHPDGLGDYSDRINSTFHIDSEDCNDGVCSEGGDEVTSNESSILGTSLHTELLLAKENAHEGTGLQFGRASVDWNESYDENLDIAQLSTPVPLDEVLEGDEDNQ